MYPWRDPTRQISCCGCACTPAFGRVEPTLATMRPSQRWGTQMWATRRGRFPFHTLVLYGSGMELIPFSGTPRRTGVSNARTTVPGFKNGSRQEVVGRTGQRSTTFAGQIIYRLKCGDCSGEYGANGCDIHARRCPHCEQGAKGEPLPERPKGLFEE
jgi:hypothetical protein